VGLLLLPVPDSQDKRQSEERPVWGGIRGGLEVWIESTWSANVKP
jgi:hypothetical protein